MHLKKNKESTRSFPTCIKRQRPVEDPRKRLALQVRKDEHRRKLRGGTTLGRHRKTDRLGG
jgi:hypothetical protein